MQAVASGGGAPDEARCRNDRVHWILRLPGGQKPKGPRMNEVGPSDALGGSPPSGSTPTKLSWVKARTPADSSRSRPDFGLQAPLRAHLLK